MLSSQVGPAVRAGQCAVLRSSGSARTFIASAVRNEVAPTLAPLPSSQESKFKAAKETHDVTAMDRLLKRVRRMSDPAHHSLMPMRSPMLWSEALLKATEPPPSPGRADAQTPPLSDPLPPRTMADSYTELVLPFGSSPELFEQYTNSYGTIRTGKMMEHLDSLAGSVAYKHMLPGVEDLKQVADQGFYIVTASVDRLDVLAPMNLQRDIKLSGQVIHTGRSSMEIAVKMEAPGPSGEDETLLLGRFSMVCRDFSHHARPVNPLVRNTAEEEALFAMGEGLRSNRKSKALQSLSRVPPTSAEAEALHSLYLARGQEDQEHPDPNRVWMSDSRQESTMLMFPQERNVHQKIFGGYLMRLAYELGFTSSSLFTRSHVRFLSLDGISFAKPVPIGSILRLTSHILHTSSTPEFPTLVHVGVQANVVDAKTGHEETTNDFRFTWCRETGEPLQRYVVPRTYKEAMLWLEGKRALELGAEIRGLRGRSVGDVHE